VAIFSLTFGLLSGLTGAADAARIAAPEGTLPDAGRLVFELSEGAQVEVLPQVQARRHEVVVRGNMEDLDAQMVGRSVRFLDVGDAWSVGGGTWLMEFETSGPNIALSIEQDAGQMVLTFAPGAPQVRQPPAAAPTVEALLSGELERAPAARTRRPLNSLDGEAAYRLEASQYPAGFTAWEPELPRSWEGELLTPRGAEDWRDIDRYRQVITETNKPDLESYGLYRLGVAHLNLGYAREASAYLERVATSEGAWPGAATHLARARAAWTIGHWDEARERCADAAAAGARDTEVLECLGIVSLETSNPPPSETGRALAAATGRPEAMLLAGQLLQRDHRHSEALSLLHDASMTLEGDLRTTALINVGDAFYAMGRNEQAREAWRDAGADVEVARITALRQRMRHLTQEGVDKWLDSVPDLYKVKDRDDRSGAEARYLLAQIAATFDDLDGAVEHLAALVDEHPDVIEGSDVTAQLWEQLDKRFRQLDRANEPLRIAALYREFYRREVKDEVEDTAGLEAVTAAFESLGLFEEALDVQREVFGVHTRQERDDPGALVTLARLYVLTNRPAEALRTLDYLAAAAPYLNGPVRGEALLVEAQVYYAEDRLQEAIRAYRFAERFPTAKARASARLALIEAEAGSCDQAVPRLTGLIRDSEGAEVREVAEGRVHLALARCLLEAGRAAEALDAAREGAGRTNDEVSRRYATWMVAEAARQAGMEGGMATDALKANDDLWAALGEDAEADDALRAELEERR